MAEPPILSSIRLPWEKSIIYFVTMCVRDRCKVLAKPEIFEAMKAAIPQLQKWHVLAGVIMPDHIHWAVYPAQYRELSRGDFEQRVKRTLRNSLRLHSWQWRRGSFGGWLRYDETPRRNEIVG